MKYNKDTKKAAIKLAKKGLDNSEISKAIGISESTFYEWRNTHPEFDEAISDARLGDLDAIENALRKRATGYEVTERTVETIAGPKGKTSKEKVAVKHIAGDVAAQKYILNNRRSKRWREKAETSVAGDLVIDIGLPWEPEGVSSNKETEEEGEE